MNSYLLYRNFSVCKYSLKVNKSKFPGSRHSERHLLSVIVTGLSNLIRLSWLLITRLMLQLYSSPNYNLLLEIGNLTTSLSGDKFNQF